MKPRAIAALLLALCMLLPCAAALASPDAEVVRVGWFPYTGGQSIDNGVYSGYNYDCLMEIARYTGWTYEFVEADFPTCADMLEKGEIDLLGNLFLTEERKALFDFSALEYGHTYTTLYTTHDSPIEAYDFERFDGMRIGVILDSANNDSLEAFSRDNGFAYDPVPFLSVDELNRALFAGRVDACILSGFIASVDTRVLAEFSPLPCYFATTKGNERVLVGLNRALNRIKIDRPYFEAELYQKHFGAPESLALTSAEQAIVERSQLQPISVGIIASSAPMCYYDDKQGEYVGMFMEILRMVSQKTGLSFEYVELDLGRGVPIAQLKNGYPNLVAGVIKTQNHMNDQEISLSDRLAGDSIVVVSRKGSGLFEDAPEKTLAVMKGFQVVSEYVAEHFPSYGILYCDSLSACMDAVADKRADATVHLESCCNYLMQNPHYENLEISPAFVKDVDTCVVSLSGEQEALIHIINKGLKQITENERNNILTNYAIMHPYTLSAEDLLYKFRIPVVVISVLAAAVIVTLSILIVSKRKSAASLSEAYAKQKYALELAQKASAAKGSFMSRMSHEIRTPLNAVIGYGAIARKELSGASSESELRDANMRVLDCLEKSDVASKHLLTIINDVLDMSAIESGNIHVAHERFDFKAMITALTALFYSQSNAKGVFFEVVFDSLPEEYFIGDQMRINQVLTNLLGNAVKFTPEGGTVKLTIREKPRDARTADVHFEVSDTGIGMDKTYLSHIWTPFEQADASISRRFGGTGLGLSITKNLVDLMHGAVSVSSRPGIGSTFAVDLVLERSEQPKTHATYDFSGIHALVADDDASTCEYIKLLFDRCGVRCQTVTSGLDAIAAIRSAGARGDSFNLCLVDWCMPDLDGMETVRRLRTLVGAELPLIIVTAYSFSEIETAARSVGVSKFLAKPLFQSTLFNLLMDVSGQYPTDGEKPFDTLDFSGARILLAEDNRMNMEIAKRILSSSGLTVDSAWNGKEAVDMFTSSPAGTYQAILMDVQMPEMDGHEATRTIRASAHPEAATVPILAMTADAFAENVAEALASGMNCHIAKPIDVPVLLHTLQKYIGV